MKRRKASRPAAARAVNGPRAETCQGLGEAITQKRPVPQREALPLDAIRVGERHRKDMGDVEALAGSMAELGLLHPIVVTPAGLLIAGERRLRAAELLGWKTIPVTVVDLESVVQGEFAENAVRKDFTLSEAVAIKRALEPLEKVAAKERMLAGKPSGKLPKGRAADKAAKATGMARRTLEKAEAIVDAAEAEPAKYGQLLKQMDDTGRANGFYRRLKIAKQAALIRAEPPPLPGRGPYRVIVIDPPWPYEKRDEDPSRRGVRPYATMSLADIRALQVNAHADSIVWLWTTNHHMREALDLLDAWRFELKTILTWAKDRMGMGDWLRGQTEHCIMAVRGKPVDPVSPEFISSAAASRACIARDGTGRRRVHKRRSPGSFGSVATPVRPRSIASVGRCDRGAP